MEHSDTKNSPGFASQYQLPFRYCGWLSAKDACDARELRSFAGKTAARAASEAASERSDYKMMIDKQKVLSILPPKCRTPFLPKEEPIRPKKNRGRFFGHWNDAQSDEQGCRDGFAGVSRECSAIRPHAGAEAAARKNGRVLRMNRKNSIFVTGEQAKIEKPAAGCLGRIGRFGNMIAPQATKCGADYTKKGTIFVLSETEKRRAVRMRDPVIVKRTNELEP